MYRTVYDLNKVELDELRDDMFWFVSDDFLAKNNVEYFWQITDEMIYNHFGGISFVDEDFMCNIKGD